MKQEMADMKQEVADMKLENARMKQEVADMKQEVADMKLEKADMKLENAHMKQEVADMKLENARMKQEVADMKLEINMLTFGRQRFASSDDDIRFYNGFPSNSSLTSFYECLLLSTFCHSIEQIILRLVPPLSIDVGRGLSRKLQLIDGMFLALYRLRCNVLEEDLGDQFSLDSSTISRILTTRINFFTLKQLPIWLI